MNEQTKELAMKYAHRMGNSVLYNAEYLEEFAELILRECLNQIDKIRDDCDEDDESQQALGAEWAGLAVARHFGIEE